MENVLVKDSEVSKYRKIIDDYKHNKNMDRKKKLINQSYDFCTFQEKFCFC